MIIRQGQVVDTDGSPSERAVRRLHREGLTLPGKPEFDIPALPDDITSLDDDALMTLFVRLTAWTAYASTKSAAAMVDERQAESTVEVNEARSLIKDYDPKSKTPVTFAKAQRLLDDGVGTAQLKYETAYAYRKMVEVLAINAERDAALVSRELTRRTRNSGVEQRASRFTA
jgi:hypothetical protein